MSCGEGYYVYGLMCPLDKKIKYVGCTYSMYQRFCVHISEARSLKKHNELYPSYKKTVNKKSEWILSLMDKGMKPEMIELFQTKDINLASDTEAQYIKEIKPDFNSKYNHKYVSRFVDYNYQYPEYEWKKKIDIYTDEELYQIHQSENQLDMLKKLCPSYFELPKEKSKLIWEIFIKKYHPIYWHFTEDDLSAVNEITQTERNYIKNELNKMMA